MFTIAVCDDNKKDLMNMEEIIKTCMEIISFSYELNSFQSGEDLLNSNNKYDLIFLDIAMNGINGIQVGKRIREINRNVKIIYTTSYYQYCKIAVNKVHAFAYLEKPIKEDNVKYQLNDIIQNIQKENEKAEMIQFKIMEITEDKRIENKIKKFAVQDIYYFEYINRRIKIKLENEEYYFSDKMKDLADRMIEYNFEMCHQSFLVNLQHIKKIKGYNIYLENNEKLPVSQKKSADFRKILNKFIQSNI